MASPKFQVSRRISERIWHTKAMTGKQHEVLRKLSQKSRRRQSDFSKQLKERTKFSLFYGNIPIKQTLAHIARTSTYLDKEKSLLFHLEKRLDVVLVRANFCDTMFKARQLITHRKVFINHRIVDIPGAILFNGDMVCFEKSHLNSVQSSIKSTWTAKGGMLSAGHKPSHLEINYKTLHLVLLYEPLQILFPYTIDLNSLF